MLHGSLQEQRDVFLRGREPLDAGAVDGHQATAREVVGLHDDVHDGVPPHVVAEVQTGGDAPAPHIDATLKEVRGREQARSRVRGDAVAHHNHRTFDWRGR